MSYTRQDFHRLRDPAGQATAWGEISWGPVNSAWAGRFEIGVNSINVSSYGLLRIQPMRPDEPTLLVMLGGVWAIRLDVNGIHRGQQFSHIQHRTDPGGTVHTNGTSDAFPGLPLGHTVGDGAYRMVCFTALQELGINAGLTWTDPPEGRPR